MKLNSILPLLTLPFLIHSSMPSLAASLNLNHFNRPKLGGPRRNQRKERLARRRAHAAGDRHAFA